MSKSNNTFYPFTRLPPELRDRIYRHHLVLPEPVTLTLASNTTFVVQHLKNCVLGTHPEGRSEIDQTCVLKCKDPFKKRKRQLPVPESVLALLLANKQISREAMHIFYQHNHFVFANVGRIWEFIFRTGDRYRYLGELSFAFSSVDALPTFAKLKQCRYLTKLHINMCYDGQYMRLNKDHNLGTASGIRGLRELRGIKVLELVGKDRVTPVDGGWKDVDINDKDAVGPVLRRDLMTPRSPWD
ncbi:hypothetical protein MMC16_006959 [Acarospora aff. strigata]|nr:hypothetical protein [Acarospora aff. strigata]